jgi:hypothetical protein
MYTYCSLIIINTIYREGKVDVLSKVSNLMIWSDNDVANDFTTMKTETGEQVRKAKEAANPTFLKNRLTIPTLFPDIGGAWCVHIKLACWRAQCGNFKNIF